MTKQLYASRGVSDSMGALDALTGATANGGDSPLGTWYRGVRDIPIRDLSDEDLARAARQGLHLPIVLREVLERLVADELRGVDYPGQMLFALDRVPAAVWREWPDLREWARGVVAGVLDSLAELRGSLEQTMEAIRAGAGGTDIVVAVPGAPERRIPIDGREDVTIGSAPDCTVMLPPEAGRVARHGAVILPSPDGSYTLHTHVPGVTLNDEPVRRDTLRSGDVVRLGRAVLRFERAEASPPRTITECVASIRPGRCGECRHTNQGTEDFREGLVFCQWSPRVGSEEDVCEVRVSLPRDVGQPESAWGSYWMFEPFDGRNCTWCAIDHSRVFAEDAAPSLREFVLPQDRAEPEVATIYLSRTFDAETVARALATVLGLSRPEIRVCAEIPVELAPEILLVCEVTHFDGDFPLRLSLWGQGGGAAPRLDRTSAAVLCARLRCRGLVDDGLESPYSMLLLGPDEKPQAVVLDTRSLDEDNALMLPGWGRRAPLLGMTSALDWLLEAGDPPVPGTLAQAQAFGDLLSALQGVVYGSDPWATVERLPSLAAALRSAFDEGALASPLGYLGAMLRLADAVVSELALWEPVRPIGLALSELAADRILPSPAVRDGLALVLALPASAIEVADEVPECRLPDTVKLLCELRRGDGEFPLRLSLFFRDRGCAPRDAPAALRQLCSAWQCRLLAFEPTPDPCAVRVFDAGGDRPARLDDQALEGDRVVLAPEPSWSGRARLASADGRFVAELREGERLLVGRSEDCDVVLDDPTVARRHAFVALHQGVLTVEDAGSHCGVLVNHCRVRDPAALRAGDEVQIGGVRLAVLVA